MIDVKEAVHVAFDYATELFDDKPALEEVEQSNDGKKWLITLSFDEISKSLGIFGTVKPERRYKIFQIDGDSKEVSSVKIRQL